MNNITVIVPLYHGILFIESVANNIAKASQEWKRIEPESMVELIFVNDTPEERKDVEERIIKVQRHVEVDGLNSIQVIHNTENRGIHFARVQGLQRAGGGWILFLDQDDMVSKDFMISQIRHGTNCDVVIANGCRCFPDKKELLYSRLWAQKLAKKERLYLFGTDMIFSPGQCLVRRDAIPDAWQKTVLYVNGCDDMFLWLLMMQEEKSFGINPNVLYYHREGNNYSNDKKKMSNSFFAMCDLLEEMEDYPDRKVAVLRRRYLLKELLKDDKITKKRKLVAIYKNIDIIYFLLYYKISGYR